MLQYIIKHLKKGDYIYVETLGDTIAGQIELANAEKLVLKKGAETTTLLENDISGIKYYESCNVVATYILKVFLYEVHPDSFYGADAKQVLDCSLFDGKVRLTGESAFPTMDGHFDFPDIIEVNDKYYDVDVVENEWDYFHSDKITSLKLPYRCKEVGWLAFEEFSKLQTVYIPTTISDIGDRMIGGKSDCKLYDFKGNFLDYEEYVEVEFKDPCGMSFEDFIRHRHFGRKDNVCGGVFGG
ncbi:MAG: hypothetical protein IKU03_06700 [Bacteroidales bacterium]|nr:hypothetical protein [Bacteroidales bacterium]